MLMNDTGTNSIVEILLNWVLNELNSKLKVISMNQAELAAALEAQAGVVETLKAQSIKILAEVQSATAKQLAAIEALKQELANGQVTDAVSAALASLEASTVALNSAVTAIDDLNPDAPPVEA
jgi:hypothetical protein